jgi:MtaA/CmuA family methyltransferase
MRYSSMERFFDALNGKPKDHVPIFPMIMTWAITNFSNKPISEVVFDPKVIVDAQIQAKEFMEYDCFYAYADSLFLAEAFGCKVRFPETGPVADPTSLNVTCLEDVDNLFTPQVTKEKRLPLILETVYMLAKYSKDSVPVLGLLPGPFTTTCRIIEPELVMRMIYRNPDVLNALLDKINKTVIEFGHALIENGADILFLVEPTASSSMISPTAFCKWVLTKLQLLIRELNVPIMLHICGDTTPILNAMEESGAAAFSLDQCMDLSEIRKKIKKGCIGGNVNPIKSLLMGTKEQIVSDTHNCLRTAGTEKFILMSGCSVPPKTSIENLRTMIETAKNYGLGPEKG